MDNTTATDNTTTIVTFVTRKAGRGGAGRDKVRVTMRVTPYSELKALDHAPAARAAIEARFGAPGLAELDLLLAPREAGEERAPTYAPATWQGVPALALRREVEAGVEAPRLYMGGVIVEEAVLERDPNRPAPRPSRPSTMRDLVAQALPSGSFRCYALSEEAELVEMK